MAANPVEQTANGGDGLATSEFQQVLRLVDDDQNRLPAEPLEPEHERLLSTPFVDGPDQSLDAGQRELLGEIEEQVVELAASGLGRFDRCDRHSLVRQPLSDLG